MKVLIEYDLYFGNTKKVTQAMGKALVAQCQTMVL
jgi:hypothetical protein